MHNDLQAGEQRVDLDAKARLCEGCLDQYLVPYEGMQLPGSATIASQDSLGSSVKVIRHRHSTFRPLGPMRAARSLCRSTLQATSAKDIRNVVRPRLSDVTRKWYKRRSEAASQRTH